MKYNEKVYHAHNLVFYVQGQGYNQGSEDKSSSCNNLKPTKVNFVELCTKVNHNLKVCHTQYLYSQFNIKVTVWCQRSKYVSAVTLKSTKANFMNIHRQIRLIRGCAMHKTLVPILKVEVTVRDRISS